MFKSILKNQCTKNFGHKSNKPQKRGFLLVELIVSIFIFSIVMTICVGALLMAIDANKKTQSLKSVLNNLNVVLDTMTKSFATGRYYYCDSGETYSIPHSEAHNCAGESLIIFLAGDDLGDSVTKDGVANDAVVYQFVPPTVDDGVVVNGYIKRIQFLNGDWTPHGPIRLTAPEVNVTDLRFYVTGAADQYDLEQPKVLIVIDGEVLAGPRSQPTKFTVQTLVSQLSPDF